MLLQQLNSFKKLLDKDIEKKLSHRLFIPKKESMNIILINSWSIYLQKQVFIICIMKMVKLYTLEKVKTLKEE